MPLPALLPTTSPPVAFSARSARRTWASSPTACRVALARFGTAPPACRRTRVLAFAHQAEVDLAAIQVDAADLHAHARADGIADAGALAAQFLARLVELEVLAAELGDVDQAFDVHARRA